MPHKPQSSCKYPGCGTKCRGSYCSEHTKISTLSDKQRGRINSRIYDEDWRSFRLSFLADHPFCSECGRYAHHVHHIEPVKDAPYLKYVESNLMALCASCHTKIENRIRNKS